MKRSHSIEDCISYLKLQPSAEQVPKVFEFLQGFEESGFDPLLGTLPNLLKRDTIPHVLSFLRSFRILDVSDCERITNRYTNQTTEEEIMALVNALNTKGPHAFWYFMHSMERINKDLFDQMHGKLICCVCDEVAQNYELIVQKEVEIDIVSAEPSLQFTRQREMLNDLLGRVEQLKASFSCLENSVTDIVEKIKPFPYMVGNLSERFRNEIKDVMAHPDTDGEVGGHTNVNVIKRLKIKCSQIKRQIESRLQSREVQVDLEDNGVKSDALKEVVCKHPNPIEQDGTTEQVKETPDCQTYEDFWIGLEDRCLERLSHYNPFLMIQSYLGDALLFGQRHKGKICCAVGIAICMKIIGSYLSEYDEWIEGPRPMFM